MRIACTASVVVLVSLAVLLYLQANSRVLAADTQITGNNAKEGETTHSADQDQDYRITLTELLRVIQFFNSGSFHCEAGTEDGFAPGSGDTASCSPHSGDYSTPDWKFNLSELLRIIQIFNSTGYHSCAEGEDGFCLGLPPVLDPPNIVFIVIDAMRADRLGAMRNGTPITPFLSGFAEGGARFTRAGSSSTWTRPSMVSHFTGLYPDVFQGDVDDLPQQRYVISDNFVTIAEWLAANGYDNWGFQANGNAGPDFGFAQGFGTDRYQLIRSAIAEDFTDAMLATMPQWQEPFFLFAQYLDPHTPFTPPAAYDAIFGPQPAVTPNDEYILSGDGFNAYLNDLYSAWVNNTSPTLTQLTANGVEALRYRYDAEIRYADDQLARILPQILSQFPNTIFVITADHGETLLEREPVIGHGFTVYEEQSRVPFIMRGPGISPGVRNYPVEVLGILPTLARLCGLVPEPVWQGHDVLLSTGEDPVYCHTQTFSGGYVRAESVATGDLKLIESTRLASQNLFDLATDPGELSDVAATHPAEAAVLAALLLEHQESFAPLRATVQEASPVLSDETRQQLEALGYLSPGE